MAGVLGALAVTALSCLPVARADAAPSPPFIGPTADWLTSVNYYRAMAGLGPIVDNPAWQAGTDAHSCYMLANGLTHYENPAKPGYTPYGDAAGEVSNVTVSSDINTSQRTHVELWMAAPFHAIGILRPGLRSSNYGVCTDTSTPPWHSAATLVVTGRDDLDLTVTSQAPILFPGPGSTTNLSTMSSETPDPRKFCGWDGEVGLPIIAMMPEAFSGHPTGTLSTSSGPVEVCILSPNNTTAAAHDPNGVAHDILDHAHAVLVVPRFKLAPTSYAVSVTTSARTVSWSFTVDPAAATAPAQAPNTGGTGTDGGSGPVGAAPAATQALSTNSMLHALKPTRIVDSRYGMNATRLAAFSKQRIQITGRGGVPASAEGVSGNFTVAGSTGGGYLTVWNCSDQMPIVSTLNFAAGETVPNGASIPLDGNGGLCVYSETSADLLIDVNGYYSDTPGGGRFAAVPPTRLMDTRTGLGGSGRLTAGTVTRLGVTGSAGVPTSAKMAVLNVTSVSPDADGYVTVYPCDAGIPEVSSLNPSPGTARPNTVITPVAADGSVCVFTVTDVDIIVDITGYITGAGKTMFTTAAPIRLTDTRSTYAELNAGTSSARVGKGQFITIKVAGERGIAANAKAISANVTAVGGATAGYLTVYPCGSQPNTSTVNFPAAADVANGAQVSLSADGSICVYANTDVHVLVDINGWWS